MSFLEEKKIDDIFVNYMNLWGEYDKGKIQKKHGLVLGLTLSFGSILQKAQKNIYYCYTKNFGLLVWFILLMYTHIFLFFFIFK